jgi:hypothetical protein
MLKRNIIFWMALAAMVGSASAQVRPGIKLGYNLSGVMANYLGDNADPALRKNAAGDPNNFHLSSGFQAGMIADCPISASLSIQPGLRFSMLGFTDKYTSNGEVNRKFSLFYLQLPVYAQYRWNVYDQTNILFQAGPYAGYGLFGRQNYNRKGEAVDLNDDQKKISFGNGNNDEDIQTGFDFGVGAGVGVEYSRFQLMLNYDFGLGQPTFYKKNAKSATYHIDMRNHNFAVTLAVIFGRKDPLQNAED